jgi:hypothetical protein
VPALPARPGSDDTDGTAGAAREPLSAGWLRGRA